ncbi:hypothetical protein J6590_088341 [Homalodisca vitripennis]|nr:hypothetical protein J6590_088341 [Homalodisca vitripennis]
MPLVDRTVPINIQTPRIGDGAATTICMVSLRTCLNLQVEYCAAILSPYYDGQHSADSRVGHGAGMCGPAFIHTWIIGNLAECMLKKTLTIPREFNTDTDNTLIIVFLFSLFQMTRRYTTGNAEIESLVNASNSFVQV